MMRYNDDIFRIQYPVVGDFVRHLAYFRAAKPIHDRLGLKAPFWTETVNTYLLIATVQWFKVFGAHGSNPTHWRNTPSKDNEAAINSFREKIRTALGCSPKEWADYHRRMCAFRDKYVVHRDDFNDPVPDFDIALNVAYAYDEWIREFAPISMVARC